MKHGGQSQEEPKTNMIGDLLFLPELPVGKIGIDDDDENVTHF